MKQSYGTFLKEAGMELLWDSVLVMTLSGTVVFGFCLWRFRRLFK